MNSFRILSRAVRTSTGRNGSHRQGQTAAGASSRIASQIRFYSDTLTESKLAHHDSRLSVLIVSLGLPEELQIATDRSRPTSKDITRAMDETNPPVDQPAEQVPSGLLASPAAGVIDTRSPAGTPTAMAQDLNIRRIGGETFRHLAPREFRELMRHVTNPVVVVSALHLPKVKPNQKYESADLLPSPDDLTPSREKGTEKEATGTTAGGKAFATSKSDTEDLADFDGGPIPRAMTISSFTSLSVDPRPTVMFSITLPSHTYSAIVSSHRFNIHVLADTQDGARIAKRLSQGHSRLDKQQSLPDCGKILRVAGRGFWRVDWRTHVTRKQAEGADYKPWTPIGRLSVPTIRDPGVLYTLRCVVRKQMHSGPKSTGIIKLDKTSAIIVGEVQEVVKMNGLSEDSIGLSYANRRYRCKEAGIEHSSTQENMKNRGGKSRGNTRLDNGERRTMRTREAAKSQAVLHME